MKSFFPLLSTLLLALGGCTKLVDAMAVSCEPQPVLLETPALSAATAQQLREVIEAHGIEVSSTHKFQAFRIEISRFALDLDALYHESTNHNLFRNITASMVATAFDEQTGELLWKKEYDAAYTLKSDPHFYSQNQLDVAKAQWALQREIFTELSADLTTLCAIQTSGLS